MRKSTVWFSLPGKNKMPISVYHIPASGQTLPFILMEEGAFTMGHDSKNIPHRNYSRSNVNPPHKVTITKSFLITQKLVSQHLFEEVTGYNPSRIKNKNLPVDSVTWNEANSFINTLNAASQLLFRLPTEAEWEYTCRMIYDNQNRQEDGTLICNDLFGQLYQWCSDGYERLTANASINPTGNPASNQKVYKGSCAETMRLWEHPAFRQSENINYRSHTLGFRMVTELNGKFPLHLTNPQ